LLIRLALKTVTRPLWRSLLIGVLAGMLWLVLNASLIDVFEASKVALVFLLLLGIAVGLVNVLVPGKKDLFTELKEASQTPLPTVLGLALLAGLVFGPSVKNYFTGDDFTWLRWALTTKPGELGLYFTQAAGFFYRPLAKLYFYAVNPFFGLRPQGYHFASLLVHFGSSVAAYLIIRLLTKRTFLASLVASLFLINPVNTESLFWISTTSHLFASFFYLWGFAAYVRWRQIRLGWRWPWLVLVYTAFIAGLLSHERAMTFPLLILAYDLFFFRGWQTKSLLKRAAFYLPFWLVLDSYFWVRNILAGAHGLSGDYNYNWVKLPFNFVGNLFGYVGEVLAGFRFLAVYDASRAYLRDHKLLAAVAILIVAGLVFSRGFGGVKKYWRQPVAKWVAFSLVWIMILLLPFLGLGNIAERYVYPAHLGILLILGLALTSLFQWLQRRFSWLAWLAVGGLVAGLMVFDIGETNRSRQEWFAAGEIANEVLRTMATNYTQFPLSSHLYFVNLPIRQHRAWVFPVGLPDALWFIYRDDSLNIYQLTDAYEAFDHAEQQQEPTFVFVYVDGELRKARQ